MGQGIIILLIIIAVTIIIFGINCIYNIIDNIIEYLLNKNITNNDYPKRCLFDAGKWFIMFIINSLIGNLFITLLKVKLLL